MTTYTIHNFPFDRMALAPIPTPKQGNNFVHHNIAVITQESFKNNTTPPNYEKYFICKPVATTSWISQSVDDRSMTQSLQFFADIYKRWPAKLPNEKKLYEFLIKMKDRYCELLDQNPQMKKQIYLITKQLDWPTKLKEDSRRCVKDIVTIPRHDTSHKDQTKAGEIDDNKSPNYKTKIWTKLPKKDLTDDEKKGKIIAECDRSDYPTVKDLLVFTTFYNNTKGKVNGKTPVLETFGELREFIYRKGDDKKFNRPQFRLALGSTIISPTVYWGESKPGEFQLKCAALEIYDRQNIVTNRRKSQSELDDNYHNAINELREIGWYDNALVEGEGEDYSDEYPQQQPQLQYPRQNNRRPVPKPTMVAVYHTKKNVESQNNSASNVILPPLLLPPPPPQQSQETNNGDLQSQHTNSLQKTPPISNDDDISDEEGGTINKNSGIITNEEEYINMGRNNKKRKHSHLKPAKESRKKSKHK